MKRTCARCGVERSENLFRFNAFTQTFTCTNTAACDKRKKANQ